MMQLEHLHRQLARLRRVRRRVRWGTAASAAAIAVLAALAIVFAIDWSFQRNEDLWQRLFLLAVGAAAIGWAVRRFALPWLGQREGQMEMALLVERQAGIDSDLVAALQFESSEAQRWGSVQLETAVVKGVSSRQASLNVMAAVPYRPLLRRLRLLILPLLFWVIVGLAFPAHVRVFFNRLLLGSQHYPTQTRIVALAVNGKSIDFSAAGGAAVRVPYGQPVQFQVKATGARSASGRVELTGAGRGQSAVVALEPSGDNTDGEGVFQGTHPRLIEPARFQVWLGDAFTDPLRLEVVPLPIIDVEPEVVPPAYARGRAAAVQKLPRGTRQFAVLEGSEVRLNVSSDRPLKIVALKVGDKPIALLPQKAASGAEGENWVSKSAGTALEAVAEPLRYTIQGTDTEDASLESPVEGVIRIEPDLPPRAVAKTKTPFVLPIGQPTIYFGASDDHAVGRIWLTWEVVRGKAAADAPETAKDDIDVYRLAAGAEPEPTHTGEYALDLAPLHLTAGDTLKVTLHASDYRGQRPGKDSVADPLVFHVTDEQGIIASLGENQRKTARQFDEIIKHELGLGGPP